MQRENADRHKNTIGAIEETRPGLARDSGGGAAGGLKCWHAYDGRQVSIVFVDGTRLNHCMLVSGGRGRARTLWITVDDTDVFIPRAVVADLWAERDDRTNAAICNTAEARRR
jgi:hypothetical protein